MKSERKLKRGISEEHYTLIGRVIVNWSVLESVLSQLIWHFLRLDFEDGRIVTGTLDARPKVRMLRALLKQHVKSNSVRGTTSDLLVLVEKMQADRNTIAHGIWGTAHPDSVPAAASMRAPSVSYHVTTELFDKERMLTLIQSIHDTADTLAQLPEIVAASQRKRYAQLQLLRTNRRPTPKDRTP